MINIQKEGIDIPIGLLKRILVKLQNGGKTDWQLGLKR